MYWTNFFIYGIVLFTWCGTQAVRDRSAKPSLVGSTPIHTFRIAGNGNPFFSGWSWRSRSLYTYMAVWNFLAASFFNRNCL